MCCGNPTRNRATVPPARTTIPAQMPTQPAVPLQVVNQAIASQNVQADIQKQMIARRKYAPTR